MLTFTARETIQKEKRFDALAIGNGYYAYQAQIVTHSNVEYDESTHNAPSVTRITEGVGTLDEITTLARTGHTPKLPLFILLTASQLDCYKKSGYQACFMTQSERQKSTSAQARAFYLDRDGEYWLPQQKDATAPFIELGPFAGLSLDDMIKKPYTLKQAAEANDIALTLCIIVPNRMELHYANGGIVSSPLVFSYANLPVFNSEQHDLNALERAMIDAHHQGCERLYIPEVYYTDRLSHTLERFYKTEKDRVRPTGEGQLFVVYNGIDGEEEGSVSQALNLKVILPDDDYAALYQACADENGFASPADLCRRLADVDPVLSVAKRQRQLPLMRETITSLSHQSRKI